MKKFAPGSKEGQERPQTLKMHPNDGILLVQAADEVENGPTQAYQDPTQAADEGPTQAYQDCQGQSTGPGELRASRMRASVAS